MALPQNLRSWNFSTGAPWPRPLSTNWFIGVRYIQNTTAAEQFVECRSPKRVVARGRIGDQKDLLSQGGGWIIECAHSTYGYLSTTRQSSDPSALVLSPYCIEPCTNFRRDHTLASKETTSGETTNLAGLACINKSSPTKSLLFVLSPSATLI